MVLLIPLLIVTVLVVGLAVVIAMRRHRIMMTERDHELDAAAAGHHLEPIADVTDALKNWSLRQLPGGAGKIARAYLGEIDERPIILFEHCYTMSNGQTTHRIRHRGASMPIPPQWPAVHITERTALGRLLPRLNMLPGAGLVLEDEAFMQRYRVKARDPRFAELLLDPAVQQVLCNAAPRQAWSFDGGYATLLEQGPLREDDFGALLETVREVFSTIPPELDMWAAESASAQGQ